MEQPVLGRDRDIVFPQFMVVKASAGSGKTYALSQRFVQFLLSPHIPNNRLKNILAMTFSNNAAKEMRGRILGWLKQVALGEERALREFGVLVDSPPDILRLRAGEVIDEILGHYGDFQVRTIDSFMTSLFQSSAIDFGYPPEFDILLDNTPMIQYAFQRFLRRVAEGTGEAALIDDAVTRIMAQKQGSSTFLWDPGSTLLEEMRGIARICAARGRNISVKDYSADIRDIRAGFRPVTDGLETAISRSGLTLSKSSSYSKSDIPGLVREGRLTELVGKQLVAPPVTKAKGKDAALHAAYDDIMALWERLRELVRELTWLHAHAYYHAFASVFAEFSGTLDEVKQRQGTLFIEDINRHLASYLETSLVPDIYFRLGETIHHFFLDEFQDTSPIQWRNLVPLLENALAGRGSVFLVGDTKQAIYGFRDADYRIMAAVEQVNPFPSAAYIVRDLGTNFRSGREILALNEKIFREIIPGREGYREAARASGLDSYVQHPLPDRGRDGFVTFTPLAKSDDESCEKKHLWGLIEEIRARGYTYGDIAILAQRNEDAVRASGWLNERAIPFLSFSSLDIRRRKITGEIIALLRFLDAPSDSLAFSTFILGDIFRGTVGDHPGAPGPDELHSFVFRNRAGRALYKAFEETWPDLWERFLAGLLRSVGYLPLYDLVSEVYHVFRLFDLRADEEATLMRLLETVKDFEGEGYNSLAEFVRFAGDDESAGPEWHMTVPVTQDAVTVMTIHKAKGLDFPVVIVVLYEQSRRPLGYIPAEEGDEMTLLRITQDMAACHEDLGARYGEAVLRDMVNSLNTLYVGLTRPKEELHLLGIAARPDRVSYPLDLLSSPVCSGAPLPKGAEDDARPRRALLLSHPAGRGARWTAAGGALRLREKQRGECIHAVLALCIFHEDAGEGQVRDIARKIVSERFQGLAADEIASDVSAFLGEEDIAPWFRKMPGRKVYTEIEIASRDGRLYRIDRLVADGETVTVIDFKTGADVEGEEEHERQIRTYAELVQANYSDRRVAGMLAFVDGRSLRRIV